MTFDEFDAFDRRVHAVPLDDALARVLVHALEGRRKVFRDEDELAAERWLKRITTERGIPVPSVKC